VTIKVYTYEELSAKAKEKACQWWEEGDYDWWWDSVYEDADAIGIKIMSFDAGQGNSIKGEILNIADCANRIIKSHGEWYETYKLAFTFKNDFGRIVDEQEADYETTGCGRDFDVELEELESEFKRAILEEYLSILRKEFEFRKSREYVEDALRVNEYEFTEDGKRFTGDNR